MELRSLRIELRAHAYFDEMVNGASTSAGRFLSGLVCWGVLYPGVVVVGGIGEVEDAGEGMDVEANVAV